MPVTTIHEQMKRCLLADDGTVNAYLDPDDSHNLEGSPPQIEGIAKSTTSGLKLFDNAAFEGVQPGQYIHNKTLDVYFQVIANNGNSELELLYPLETLGDRWGDATSTSTDKLVDTAGDFVNKGVTGGMVAAKRDLSEHALVTGVSETELDLDSDIFSTGDDYSIIAGFREGDEYEVCTAVLDGSAGQVMVEIPKFYFRYEFANETHRWAISETPQKGFSLHPAFTPAGRVVDHIYYSAFEGVIDARGPAEEVLTAYNLGEAVLGSKAGFLPVVRGQRSEFRTVAANRGSGWQLQDWHTLWALQLLFLVEYEDLHSQGILTAGFTDWVWSTRDNYVVSTNSRTIALTGWSLKHGNGSAGQALGDGVVGSYVTYRGVESFWGHIWKWTDGVNYNDGRVHLANNPPEYEDDISAPPFIDTGFTQPNETGMIVSIHPSPYGFLVASVDNTIIGDNVYLPDRYWFASGWRVARSGGSVYDGITGDLAGFAALNALSSSSLRSTVVGSRVCFREITEIANNGNSELEPLFPYD